MLEQLPQRRYVYVFCIILELYPQTRIEQFIFSPVVVDSKQPFKGAPGPPQPIELKIDVSVYVRHMLVINTRFLM